jgi:hypothetical protein
MLQHSPQITQNCCVVCLNYICVQETILSGREANGSSLSWTEEINLALIDILFQPPPAQANSNTPELGVGPIQVTAGFSTAEKRRKHSEISWMIQCSHFVT